MTQSNDEAPSPETWHALRLLEAALFASVEPLSEPQLATLPGLGEIPLRPLLEQLAAFYEGRGVQLERSAGNRWAYRTAADLAAELRSETEREKKPSRAALETLAIVAYHQPVTRGEIEAIRGVAVAKGTLDILLEAGWIRPRGRREAPGRPLLWGTTAGFLDAFGLTSLRDLPGQLELKAAGLLDPQVHDAPFLPPQDTPSDGAEPTDAFEAGAAEEAALHMRTDADSDRDPEEVGRP